MGKIPESFYTLIKYVMQVRPDLTEKQAVAATVELHKDCVRYLAKGKGLPSIMTAIYEVNLTEEELAAYWELDFDQQKALWV